MGNADFPVRPHLIRARSSRRNLTRQPSDGPPSHPKRALLRKIKSSSNVRFRGVEMGERRSAWGDSDDSDDDFTEAPPTCVARQTTSSGNMVPSTQRMDEARKKSSVQPKGVLRNKGATSWVPRKDSNVNGGCLPTALMSPLPSYPSSGDRSPKLPVRSSVPRSSSLPVFFRKDKNEVHTVKRWDELLGTSRNSPRKPTLSKVLPKIPLREEYFEQALDILSSTRSQSDETFDSIETDATPRMSGNRLRDPSEEQYQQTHRLSLLDDDEEENYNLVQDALNGFPDRLRQHASMSTMHPPPRISSSNYTLPPISESPRLTLTRFRSSPTEIRRSSAMAAAAAQSTTQSLPMPPRRSTSPSPPRPPKSLSPKALQALARKSVSIARQRRSDWKTYTDTLTPPSSKISGRRESKQVTEEITGPCYYYLSSTNRYARFDTEDQQLALALYPDSVGQSYEALVPRKTSDSEFWERYFFRCSEKAIFQALQRQEGYVSA